MYTNRNETRNSADLRKLMGFKLSNARFQSHYQLIPDQFPEEADNVWRLFIQI